MIQPMEIEEKQEKNEETILPTWAYATKKTIASGMLNVTLLLSNARAIKTLYEEDTSHRGDFWTVNIVLLISSIALQVIAALLLFILSLLKPKREEHKTSMDILNNCVTGLILFISIINVITTGFGIQLDENTKRSIFNTTKEI